LWGGVGAVAALVAISVVPWLASGRREPAPRIEPPPPKAEAPVEKQLDDQKLRDMIARQFEEQRRLEEQKKEPQKQPDKPPRQGKTRPEPLVPKTQPKPSTPPMAAAPKPEAIPEPPAPKTESAAPATPQPAAKPPAPKDLLADAQRAIERGRHAEGAAMLKALAESGNARAMVRLGELHLIGQGVERSDQLALRLFRGASDLGDSEAHQRLGEMYTKGRGVPQNSFQAYTYFSAAVRCGNAAAKGDAERAARALQTVEIQQASKLGERLACAAKDA
jgi:hypothetical protein